MTLTAVFEKVSSAPGGGSGPYAEQLPGVVSEGALGRSPARTSVTRPTLLLEADRELTAKRSPGEKEDKEERAEITASVP